MHCTPAPVCAISVHVREYRGHAMHGPHELVELMETDMHTVIGDGAQGACGTRRVIFPCTG